MTRIEALLEYAKSHDPEKAIRLAYWYGQSYRTSYQGLIPDFPEGLDDVHSFVEERADTDGA